jgi:hypothetical protein
MEPPPNKPDNLYQPPRSTFESSIEQGEAEGRTANGSSLRINQRRKFTGSWIIARERKVQGLLFGYVAILCAAAMLSSLIPLARAGITIPFLMLGFWVG